MRSARLFRQQAWLLGPRAGFVEQVARFVEQVARLTGHFARFLGQQAGLAGQGVVNERKPGSGITHLQALLPTSFCWRARLRRRAASGALALAQARAAHQLVLGRVIAIHTLDGGAHALDRVPHLDELLVALVAQIGQLLLQCGELALNVARVGQGLGQGGLGERASAQIGADLLAGGQDLGRFGPGCRRGSLWMPSSPSLCNVVVRCRGRM